MSKKEELLEASMPLARKHILEVLADGPLTTGDSLSKLGYDGTTFMLTEMIGDGANDWHNSAHRIAKTDMIDEGVVLWCKDEYDTVWYGLKEDEGMQKHLDSANKSEDDIPWLKLLNEVEETIKKEHPELVGTDEHEESIYKDSSCLLKIYPAYEMDIPIDSGETPSGYCNVHVNEDGLEISWDDGVIMERTPIEDLTVDRVVAKIKERIAKVDAIWSDLSGK